MNIVVIIILTLLALVILYFVKQNSDRNTKDHQVGFNDLLDYSSVIAEGVVLLKSGALVSTWLYKGIDSETLTNHVLNARTHQVNNVLSRFGSGWMSQHNNIRVESNDYPVREKHFFPDEVTQTIDEERRLLFETKGINHENEMYVTLTWLPPLNMVNKLKTYFVENSEPYSLASVKEKHMQYFAHQCDAFENQLSSFFTMEKLGEITRMIDTEGTEATYDEQLEFFRFCITGKRHPFKLPNPATFIDTHFAHGFHTGITPKIDDLFVQTIAIEGYPEETVPAILEGLDRLPFTYRWQMRFVYQDSHVALGKIKKYQLKWQQGKRGFWDQLTQNYMGEVNTDAVAMENEAIQAKADARRGVIVFGHFTMVLVLMEKDLETIYEASKRIVQLINTIGFTARVETGNSTDSFIGSFPAHAQEDLREPILNTLEISTILPSATIWAGQKYNPCDKYIPQSPALIQCASTSGTPFRLNIHVGDLGHTLIFGPSGSGKSTLLGLMAAQSRKYKDSRVFVFDMKRSMLPLTYAIEDAVHYDLAIDESIGFCPFSKIENDNDALWTEEWIITMLNLQEIRPTPRQKKEIRSAISNHRIGKDKSLHDFVVNLQDRELKDALSGYIVSQTKNKAILDSEEDSLRDSRFNVFELEELLGLGDSLSMPVLLYLFRQIEKSLDGNPSFIYIDEGWLPLGHELFREKFRVWLKVLRDKNCCVILSTQNISDAKNSGLLDVINENCPTKIYLPNPTALDLSSTKLYKELGLNIREIELLSQAVQKRDYYFRSSEGRRWFQLDLGAYALSFIGASGITNIERVKQLHAKHGKKWIWPWLVERGVIDESQI